MCIYVHICQEENKCCMLVLDKGDKRVCSDTEKKKKCPAKYS